VQASLVLNGIGGVERSGPWNPEAGHRGSAKEISKTVTPGLKSVAIGSVLLIPTFILGRFAEILLKDEMLGCARCGTLFETGF
jgi:hypothetical protein